jgi:hypothetical protein
MAVLLAMASSYPMVTIVRGMPVSFVKVSASFTNGAPKIPSPRVRTLMGLAAADAPGAVLELEVEPVEQAERTRGPATASPAPTTAEDCRNRLREIE